MQLREDILLLNSNLEANFHKNKIYIVHEDDLAATLKYSQDSYGVSVQCI